MTKEIRIPPVLLPGDRVTVVAPSGLVDRERTESGIRVIESWGYSVERGEHLYSSDGVLAGTDDSRLADLQKALDDPVIRAVFCARGGYGLSRIVDRLDFSGFSKNPKWIVGFSDITLLHIYAGIHSGVATLHGEMVLNYAREDHSTESRDSVKDIIGGVARQYRWSPVISRPGHASGIITGGNLSLLCNMLGAGLADYLEGKILFVEETGEMLYRIDRMVQALRLAGVFRRIAGLVTGEFSGISDSDIPFGKSPVEMLTEASAEGSYPVVSGFPAGHCSDNRALIMGAEADLDITGREASLVWKSI